MKTKKVVLMGNYGNHNNGDEAILLGAVNALYNSGVEKNNIIILSNNDIDTFKQTGIETSALIVKSSKYKMLNVILTIFNLFKIFRQSNKLILGGGGVLMDLYKRDLPIYGTAILISKLLRNKVMTLGVGAGPVNTKLGALLLNIILRLTDKITVRDELSKNVLERYTKKKVRVVSDLAFFMPATNYKDIKNSNEHDKIKIGITTLPYYSDVYWPKHDETKYIKYINNLNKTIQKISNNKVVEFYLFSTKYPEDVFSSEDLYKINNNKNVKIIREELSAHALKDFMQNLDLVIGTRLHSLILATSIEKPIVAISYHKKVEGYMKKYNLDNEWVDIDSEFNEVLTKIVIKQLEEKKVANIYDKKATMEAIKEFYE